MPRLFSRSWILFLLPLSAGAEVVLNEIHYDPVDQLFSVGSLREYVELFNPGPQSVDLSGYRFSAGIQYEFPPGTNLAPLGYLVVVRDPSQFVWSQADFPVFGPFEGQLSNEGELLQLTRPDTSVVEDLYYEVGRPWPTGANGYGPPLERISWDLPANDPHSWRASTAGGGTAGRENQVVGTPPRPLIAGWRTVPANPSSNDPVTIRIEFDSPELIASVQLRWETLTLNQPKGGSSSGAPVDEQATFVTSPMTLAAVTPAHATYAVTLPPMPSQTLVRFCAEVTLTNALSTILPHSAEARPYESYFVYDGEIDSSLPILWKFDARFTNLPGNPRTGYGVAFLPIGETQPRLFDGASLLYSRNGQKIRFLKGEEYRGDRTLNLIPESPPEGTTAGFLSPHLEHLGFEYFRDLGNLTPRVEWYRVISSPNSYDDLQTQRLVIQQVNEKFLEMHGRDPEGYLYKRGYSTPQWEPHTRKEEGFTVINNLQRAILTIDPDQRRKVIETELNTVSFRNYGIASVLLTNWDGFHNNHWMYKGPNPEDKWEIIPWDLDKVWGYVGGPEPFMEFPHTFPRDGRSSAVSRAPGGPITGPFFRDMDYYEEYLTYLRLELEETFTEEYLFERIEDIETLLLDDLQRLEQALGAEQVDRRQQILESYAFVRKYIADHRAFLDETLPPISPAVLAPRPEFAYFLGRDRIALAFDRGLDLASAETPSHYLVDRGVGSPQSARLDSEKTVVLTFAEPLCSEIPYVLSVHGVQDATYEAAIDAPRSVTTGYYTPPVSITEIQYDNRGDDVEWVELFNTTGIPLDVSRWTLTDDDEYPARGEGSAMLPLQTVLLPGETIVVNLWNSPIDPDRPDYDLWNFPEDVRVVDAIVLSRGSLDNEGDNLALFTGPRDGVLVDGSLTVPFPDSSVDGSSIERIDPLFPWADALAVSAGFTACTSPIGFTTGLNENNRRLSDFASPGEVPRLHLHADCLPNGFPTITPTPADSPTPTPTATRDFDLAHEPEPGRIDANDLLEWFGKVRAGSEETEILMDFSRYWGRRSE